MSRITQLAGGELFANQRGAQVTHLHGIDTSGAVGRQTDTAVHELGRGRKPAVNAVDVDGCTVLSTVDEDLTAVDAESDTFGLVFAERGDAGSDA